MANLKHHWVETSGYVFDAIWRAHNDKLVVFESCSDPDGGLFGRPRMDTVWGFKDAAAPLLQTEFGGERDSRGRWTQARYSIALMVGCEDCDDRE